MSDTPVAMPGPYGGTIEMYSLDEQPRGPDNMKFTPQYIDESVRDLENYFRGLNKLDYPDDIKDKQIGGTHYRRHDLQPWDIFMAYGLDPWTANVIKYVLRFPYKNGIEDLKKAAHYLEYSIEHHDRIKSIYYNKQEDNE